MNAQYFTWKVMLKVRIIMKFVPLGTLLDCCKQFVWSLPPTLQLPLLVLIADLCLWNALTWLSKTRKSMKHRGSICPVSPRGLRMDCTRIKKRLGAFLLPFSRTTTEELKYVAKNDELKIYRGSSKRHFN